MELQASKENLRMSFSFCHDVTPLDPKCMVDNRVLAANYKRISKVEVRRAYNGEH